MRPSENARRVLARFLGSLVVALCALPPCAAEAPKIKEPAVAKELLEMMKVDQEYRQAAIASNFKDAAIREKLHAIDEKNTARMKEIVDRYGWPGKTLVGTESAHAAWLLVQHADRNREFQKKCLALMEKALKQDEVSGQDVAYLTDRVLIGEKKKQIYGTQFQEEDGKMVPLPIEDEANIDKRRKAVGLVPLAEYRKLVESMYLQKK